jgi:hypothetical protein
VNVLSLFQFSPLKPRNYSRNSSAISYDLYSSVKQTSQDIRSVLPVRSSVNPVGAPPVLNATVTPPTISMTHSREVPPPTVNTTVSPPTVATTPTQVEVSPLAPSSSSQYYSGSSISSAYNSTSGYSTPTVYPLQSTYCPTDPMYYQSFNNSFTSPPQNQGLSSSYMTPVEVQRGYSPSAYLQSRSGYVSLGTPGVVGMGMQPGTISADMLKQEFKSMLALDAIPDYDYLEFGKTDIEHSCKVLTL